MAIYTGSIRFDWATRGISFVPNMGTPDLPSDLSFGTYDDNISTPLGVALYTGNPSTGNEGYINFNLYLRTTSMTKQYAYNVHSITGARFTRRLSGGTTSSGTFVGDLDASTRDFPVISGLHDGVSGYITGSSTTISQADYDMLTADPVVVPSWLPTGIDITIDIEDISTLTMGPLATINAGANSITSSSILALTYGPSLNGTNSGAVLLGSSYNGVNVGNLVPDFANGHFVSNERANNLYQGILLSYWTPHTETTPTWRPFPLDTLSLGVNTLTTPEIIVVFPADSSGTTLISTALTNRPRYQFTFILTVTASNGITSDQFDTLNTVDSRSAGYNDDPSNFVINIDPITFVDSSDRIIGSTWFNPDNNELKIWTGSEWDTVTGAQGMQGVAGPQGPQGDVGPAGPAGADGVDGASGIIISATEPTVRTLGTAWYNPNTQKLRIWTGS